MTIQETIHAGAFIVSEAPGFHSRDTAVIAGAQMIVAGQTLGKTFIPSGVTSSVSADAGNTGGSGTLTLDATTPVLAGARNGVYRVVCIEPGANAGIFAVFDPDGVEFGRYTVGGADFANEIKFTISDATDFAAGDAFSVMVGIESFIDEQFKAFDPAATDGAQRIAALAVSPATTGVGETKRIAIISRNAEVRAADLSWPDGITAVQKAAAIEHLGALGIVLR